MASSIGLAIIVDDQYCNENRPLAIIIASLNSLLYVSSLHYYFEYIIRITIITIKNDNTLVENMLGMIILVLINYYSDWMNKIQ